MIYLCTSFIRFFEKPKALPDAREVPKIKNEYGFAM